MPNEVNNHLIWGIQRSLTRRQQHDVTNLLSRINPGDQCSYYRVINEIENYFIFSQTLSQPIPDDLPVNRLFKGQKGEGKTGRSKNPGERENLREKAKTRANTDRSTISPTSKMAQISRNLHLIGKPTDSHGLLADIRPPTDRTSC